MSTDSVSVKFTCTKCGETSLELPDDYTDDSIATCKQCGVEMGRWGDIKAKAMDAVRDHVRTSFRDALKGVKGIEFK
jgi:transcription elongation factor Elf1